MMILIIGSLAFVKVKGRNLIGLM